MAVTWFEMTVEVSRDLSEAVANFLVESGSPGTEWEEHDGDVRLIAYFSGPPPLEAIRRFCADIGAASGATAIRTREVADEDWSQSWRPHFRPQRIGDRLYVCPPWDSTPPPGRLKIVIDPGMAFGTGQHASTRGCLTLLEWAVLSRQIGRALDLGTGSGVLAIALAKLGAREVWAVDTDPQALAIAEQNCARNGVRPSLRFASNLDQVPEAFDFIIANLFANILTQRARQLTGLLAASGMLICSGLLSGEDERVRGAYEGCGLEFRKRYEEDGWVSLALQRSTTR
jgi:ribosomal protein L11 methyltransferase